MTWKLFLLLRAELQKRGFRVLGTRNDRTKDLMVYDRGQKAGGADLFLSLHSNACENASVRRVVVIPPFCDTDGTYALANALGSAVSEVMETGENYQICTRTYTDGAGRTRDYYGVIRGAVDAGCRRALILEHGFHTNRESAVWLSRNENLKQLAVCEADVIAKALSDAVKTPDKPSYAIGEPYTVRSTDRYSTGCRVPDWVVGKTFTVQRILPGRILLSEINSWVAV